LVPGNVLLGGVLALGTEYLSPSNSMEDISTELKCVNQQLQNISSNNEDVSKASQKVAEEILVKLEDQIEDTRHDLRNIKTSIDETLLLVTDQKYKDGLETIDSAYEVFIQESESGQFKEFEHYSFHLKTMAKKYLSLAQVTEYLTIVFGKGGQDRVQNVMDNILVARAKVVLIFVYYNMMKQEKEKVKEYFHSFTKDYEQYVDMFEKVTGFQYLVGRDLVINLPAAQINPKPKEIAARKLTSFLKAHNLLELEDLLTSRGIVVEDLVTMTEEDMLAAGIQSYKLRKMMMKAVKQLDNADLCHGDCELNILAQHQIGVSSLIEAGETEVADPNLEETVGWLSSLKTGLSSIPVPGWKSNK